MSLFLRDLQLAGFGFEPCRTPTEFSNARLKLGLLDQSFSVTVDEPSNRAAGFGQPAVDRVEFQPTWAGLRCIQAPLVLRQHTLGILQQPTHLGPYRLIERLNRHQPRVAPTLTMEPAAVSAAAPVVAPLPTVVMAGEPVAAFLADEQPAQQLLHTGETFAVALSVLLQPLRSARKQRLVDNRRHRYADVLLGWRRDLAERLSWQAAMPPWRVQGGLPGQALAAAKDGLASVGRVQQQDVDHCPAPMRLAGWAGDMVRMQPSADGCKRQTLMRYPDKDLADDACRVFINDVARSAARLARD